MHQLDIFELTKEHYKITKPIRLIELFAGIGSQAQALKNLGVNFEHYKVVEFDQYAMDSYNAIHQTTFETTDVTKIHAEDLEIEDTDIYEYILTYSFPCQSLSKSGKGEGMKKGSGTRSGLLWEVERILNECSSLPQVLLMENVPDVCGSKHIKDFQLWLKALEELGYSNYIECLNAKNYGIPQNRNRAFMISILGDWHYKFPMKEDLQLRLKDMLEEVVDEKYYLNNDQLQRLLSSSYDQNRRFNDLDSICHTVTTKQPKIICNVNPSGKGLNGNVYVGQMAPTLTTNKGEGPKMLLEGFAIPENTKRGYALANEGDGIYINRPHQKRGVVQKGMIQTLKTSCTDVAVVIGSSRPNAYVGTIETYSPTLTASMGTGGGNVPMIINQYHVRKLTPLECWRLMGFQDEAFYNAEVVNSKTQLYKQAGNSIVVNVLMALFNQFFI